jgi:organic radical activating enzyme
MPPKIGLSEVDRLRRANGRSVLLFLTDRCPVGCAHCSVDSRRDSPTIDDFTIFRHLLDGIAGRPGVELVGISGGEPFVERRGLIEAVERLSNAGKILVLYTSGVWARSETPTWIRSVLSATDCVFLSTDGYHAEMLPDDRFIRAAHAVRDADVSLIVQVIRLPKMVARAESLLQRAFGECWRDEAELSLTPPLPYGRGANVFHRRSTTVAHEFGPCPALAAPVVRYDGRVTACCNEQIITGHGPARLRADCADGDDIDAAFARWQRDPLISAIRTIGPGPLTEYPSFHELRSERFSSICDLCWRMLLEVPESASGGDRVLDAIARVNDAAHPPN